MKSSVKSDLFIGGTLRGGSAPRRLSRLLLLAALCLFAQAPARAQTNCPSGIVIHVNSGENMITVWSPLSNGDYHISRGWFGSTTHTRGSKDQYALDLNIAGTGDLGKAVFLPITGRVWTAYKAGTSTNPNYGYTAMIWDPGSGVLIRLAHLNGFSSAINNAGGAWLGAGTKAGYIGESGCPGCGTHLHMSAYRNVLVGAWTGSRNATEQDIVSALSQGVTPSFAQPQKFRVTAPSDNCDLIRFDKDPTVYTFKNGILYPVTFDVWRSWGLSLNLTPQLDGTYDQTAGRIPVRVLPTYQRGYYYQNGQLAPPRIESVFRGDRYPDTYVYRWGQKNFLNANQFGTESWKEFRWTEVQVMNQNFVDQINPRTYR